VGREVVEATPEDHPERANRLSNLGGGLGHRYLRTGAMADLEDSIQLAREAVEATPEDHPERSRHLYHLGLQLGDRYSRIEAMADLEESIRLGREAVDATPEDHPDRADYLNALGIGLSDRYLQTGAMAELEESIRVGREALKATPEDNPNRATRLNSLRVGLSDRFRRTGAMADLEEAVAFHQFALNHVTSPTIERIWSGQEVLRCCPITSHWQQAYEASDIAIHLIPKLTSRPLENSDKQHMLGQVAGFASDAAAVALRAGKGPLVALNFLEQGRGVLTESLEEIRTDVLALREGFPKLAEQFDHLRDKLELPFSRYISSTEQHPGPSLQAQMDSRYEVDKKLNELIAEFRKQPGFEDFLGAPTRKEMLNAARCGPIVIINVSELRSDAMIVQQHDIRFLALPNLNIKQINQNAQRNDLGHTKVLEWLWDTIMNPILDALGFTHCPTNDNWPHVWWIPTGPLSKFPLHAAGYHEKGSCQTVLDRVMSSYSSSIKAIIHGRRRRIMPFISAQALLVLLQRSIEGNLSFLLQIKR
jgi:tetratricopeptide (TPR) repeat protein